MCNRTGHNLKVIYVARHSAYDEAAVVRWCEDCGAVVVDIDLDNRTHPGAIIQMQFPKNYLTNQQR